MATIQDLGKVAYLNKGMYNSETDYEINDVVSYNGSSYVSKTNENRGNLPTNSVYWSVVALKGDKGDTGKPFVIEKTYVTIEAMVADYDNMNVNDYVMISGNIEEEQNATLWTKTENEVSPYKWVYLADFSGASGITGATPNISIGNVTEGNEPAVTRRAGSTNENPILDFVLKTGAKGDKGDKGDTGNGIESTTKTGTSGLIDTYTILYTDGNTTTFTVTNGEDSNIPRSEFDELKSENKKLKEQIDNYNKQLPQVEGEGTEVTLEDTIEAPFTILDVEGNSVQDGTPSPDNEVPILSSGDNGTINEKIQTKNLLPNVATSQTKNGIDFTIYNDGTVKANGTSTGYAVITIANLKLPRENYILNGCPTGGGGSTYLLRTQNGVNISDVFDTGSGANISITEKSGSADIKLQISPNVTINNLIFKPMIRLATITDDTYIPHEEQDYSIEVQQPMRSIGDVRDGFVQKDGSWYERHYIGRYLFTGNESVNLLSSNDKGYLFQIAKNFPLDNYTTNYLNNYSIPNSTSSSSDADIGSYIFNGTYRLRVPSTIATNVEEFKNWLKTANNTIYYPLDEPLDLTCNETQIQQLENKPSTYKDFTIIQSEDETEAYLEVSGIYDLNNLINN